MCGRFSQFSHLEVLREYFAIDNCEIDLPPRYNVSPENQVEVIVEAEGKRVLRTMKWGLIPFWSKTLVEKHLKPDQPSDIVSRIEGALFQ